MTMPAYNYENLHFVEAEVNYVVDNGIRPVTYIAEMGESNRRDEIPDRRIVPIYDVRPVANQLTLDDNGFTFLNEKTAVNLACLAPHGIALFRQHRIPRL